MKVNASCHAHRFFCAREAHSNHLIQEKTVIAMNKKRDSPTLLFTSHLDCAARNGAKRGCGIEGNVHCAGKKRKGRWQVDIGKKKEKTCPDHPQELKTCVCGHKACVPSFSQEKRFCRCTQYRRNDGPEREKRRTPSSDLHGGPDDVPLAAS